MSKESAEEKLLKMMQKTVTSAAAKPASSMPPPKKLKFAFTIGTLNVILFAGILACIGGLAYEVNAGNLLLKESVEFPRESKTESSMADIALPATPSVEYYLQKINERNIFKPYVPKPVAKKVVLDLTHRMSKFKLVGISWLDLPETACVMIEDVQKDKTYFLKQGEQLEGVTVKTIYTDRAVFSHENEEITIKL